MRRDFSSQAVCDASIASATECTQVPLTRWCSSSSTKFAQGEGNKNSGAFNGSHSLLAGRIRVTG